MSVLKKELLFIELKVKTIFTKEIYLLFYKNLKVLYQMNQEFYSWGSF